MIRKYHIHKLQTIPWHRDEEPHNNRATPGRQTKQNKQLSLPHQEKLQKRAARIILNADFSTPSKVMFDFLKLIPIHKWLLYTKATLTYNLSTKRSYP